MAGIDFNGQCFTDRRSLGRALKQTPIRVAMFFWFKDPNRNNYEEVLEWLAYTLGETELAVALQQVHQNRDLKRTYKVMKFNHLLCPEEPITVDGVLLLKDALRETARRAWQGDEEATAQLLRTALDARVEFVADELDKTGKIAEMLDAWKSAAENYAKWRNRLRQKDISIPNWRESETETEDRCTRTKVAGVRIKVDMSTGRPRLPARPRPPRRFPRSRMRREPIEHTRAGASGDLDVDAAVTVRTASTPPRQTIPVSPLFPETRSPIFGTCLRRLETLPSRR